MTLRGPSGDRLEWSQTREVAMITTYDLMVAHPFLTGLPPRHVERLSRWAARAPFRAGTRIFQEHSNAKGFWLIRDGFVNLDIRVPGRGDVIVETLGAGDVLGWSWMFPPYRWHFGAVVAEPVLAIAVDGEGARGLCEVEPAFGYELTKRFMAVVVGRMQASRMRLLDMDDSPT
jgi:CRP/FNR family cyclic AMP-dependent transcriptional regulator